jgi:hypothetical protein
MSWTDETLTKEKATLLLDFYKCKTCDLTRDGEPLFSCLNGHFVCGHCKNDSTGCPSCSNKQLERHQLAEDLLMKATAVLKGISQPTSSPSGGQTAYQTVSNIIENNQLPIYQDEDGNLPPNITMPVTVDSTLEDTSEDKPRDDDETEESLA